MRRCTCRRIHRPILNAQHLYASSAHRTLQDVGRFSASNAHASGRDWFPHISAYKPLHGQIRRSSNSAQPRGCLPIATVLRNFNI
jgi:hypothetical protein